MSRQNRTQLMLGVLLILLGAWFIAVKQVPALKPYASLDYAWPFYVIGAGVVLLIIGLLTGAPRMAIPASIVAGIGGILYYQYTQNQDWTSWEFMWTLIPAFVGIGNILAGLFEGDFPNSLGRGINLIVISAVLFLVFTAFFGKISILGNYGAAALLILLGLYIIGRGLMRSRTGGKSNAS
jgi:hypothetical protein